MSLDEMEADERPVKRRRLSINENEATHANDVESHQSNITSSEAEEEQEAKDREVGIRNYVNPKSVPLSGTLKQRYTDFMVNEILLDGTVLHLQNTKASKQRSNKPEETPVQPGAVVEVQTVPTKQDNQQNTDGQNEKSAEAESGDIADSDREQLVEYLNETAAGELIKLYQSIRAHPNKKSREHPVVRTDFTSDRSLRGKIHQFIRQTFHSRIDSSTDHEGVLILTAVNKSQRGNQQNDNRTTQRFGKVGWAERGGEYLHFTLYKENKDTMEAISYLARQLKCNAKSFQFAGTKDRRAVTTQRCSAYRVEAERLAAQNGNFRNSKVGDFQYHSRGLDLGDLKGNEFVITLRDTSMSSSGGEIVMLKDLENRVSDLHTDGFINYYGHQRFGTFSMRTDVIGGYILREDFQAACDAILHFIEPPSSDAAGNGSDNAGNNNRTGQDDIARAQAISLWRSTNNANRALDILPRKFSGEAHLIRHLSRHPNDYYGALMLIQRNLRLMYVHAYQSYVWNFAASNRIKLYGSKVVPGDLVLVNEHKEKESVDGQAAGSTGSNDPNANTDADGDPILEPDSTDRAKNADNAFERARVLTTADIEAHDYTIFDLVLPQPGFDILYPDNESGKFYEEFMKSEAGGKLDPYDMRRKHRDFSLAGAYRKIVGRIGEGWSVQVHEYEKDDEQFVKTDWDVLQAARNAKESPAGGDTDMDDGSRPNNGQDNTNENANGPRKTAVVLKFQLGSSQYATMALRELSGGGIRAYKPEFSSGR